MRDGVEIEKGVTLTIPYLEENKESATSIMDKALKSKLAREAARKAREEANHCRFLGTSSECGHVADNQLRAMAQGTVWRLLCRALPDGLYKEILDVRGKGLGDQMGRTASISAICRGSYPGI